MATYKHLRSSTANKRPTTSIADGQLAINTNTASPGLFFKDSAGTGIVKVGPVHVGTTAPNSSPAGSSGNYVGEQWLDTSVSPAQMKVWNGSAWIGVVADELPVSKLQDGAPRQLVQTDAAGTGVEWTSNIDVPGTLDVTGATTLDSTLTVPLGSAAAPTLRFTGDTNTGLYSPGADQVAISTNGTGRLFVDASGNVGVGTTSPNYVLDVAGTGSISAAFTSTDSENYIALKDSGTTLGHVRVGSISNELTFRAGNSERARIDSSGRLGLGTSSPGSVLDLGEDYLGRAISWHGSSSQALGSIWTSYSSAELTLGRGLIGSTTVTGGFESSSSASTSRSALQLGQGTATIFTDSAATVAYGTPITPTPRFHIDSSGNVGIGTTSPGFPFQVKSTTNAHVAIWDNGGIPQVVGVNDANGSTELRLAGQVLSFTGNGGAGSEHARITSSGQLLVGTSSSRTGYKFETEGTASNNSWASFSHNSNDVIGAILKLLKSRGTAVGSNTIVQSGDIVGRIDFDGTDGSVNQTAAQIYAVIDGTPGAADMPGRLVFSTTADGASSPTERMRISSSGNVYIGTTVGNAPFTVAGTNIEVINTNGAYVNNSQTTSVSTSATTIVADAGFQGRLWVINGATGGDRFCDLVMASTAAAPVVVQSFTAIGSPAARTYTRSGSALQLAMASGTYDVRCIGMGA